MTPSEVIITRIRAFWMSFAESDLDFRQMGQLLRGAFRVCDFKRNPEFLGEIESMTDELERYLPLMNLKEFLYCTQAIKYARTQILFRRGSLYATGLSRQLSEDERALLRAPSVAGDLGLAEQPDLNGNDFAADLLDDDDGDSES